MPAPVTMRLSEVPGYLSKKHGFTVSSRTVRFWATRGLRNETLETTRMPQSPSNIHAYVYYTTDQWVDQFVTRCGITGERTI